MQNDVEIVDVPRGERARLEQILEESFEGWYLRHSKKTLAEVETVRAAKVSGEAVGLIMVKTLEGRAGYVFYVAVAKANRGTGVAGLLVRDALRLFRAAGLTDAFASVEQDNLPSEKLFAAEGFTRTSLAEVSRKYGLLHSLNMYRTMVVVPGEILLHRALEKVT
jgi:ribosomal protein S18 acetylase RimI-like enzyme